MGETSNPMARQSGGSFLFNAEQGANIDTVGTIVLGLLCLILLLAYMRAQGRNRKLIEKIVKLERA